MAESIAYLAWQWAAVMALGAGVFLLRAGPVPRALERWSMHVITALTMAVVVAFGAGLWVISADATRILGHSPHMDWPVWQALLTHTRVGQAWLARQALLVTLMATLIAYRRQQARALLASAMQASALN